MAQPKVIVIAGMHRSGTSLVTRSLAQLGVFLGGPLLGRTPCNPQGHYEHLGLLGLNDELLFRLGSSWHDLTPFPEGWTDSHRVKALVPEFLRMVEENFQGQALWGVKDPRLCLLLPFWEQLFQTLGLSPHFVLVLRDPQEVAISLQRRNNISLVKGHLLWLRYMLALEFGSRGYRRSWVSFHRFTGDPAQGLPALANSLELPCPETPDLEIRSPRPARDSLNHPVSDLSATVFRLLQGLADGESNGLSELDEKRDDLDRAASLFSYPEATQSCWENARRDVLFRLKRFLKRLQFHAQNPGGSSE